MKLRAYWFTVVRYYLVNPFTKGKRLDKAVCVWFMKNSHLETNE